MMAATLHNANMILPDIHPGNILLAEFLVPLNLLPGDIAMRTTLGITTINGILSGVIGIDPEIGRQLDSYFDMVDGYWFGLQQKYYDEMATALCLEQ
ncbi:transcriptional regulator [Undibacterium sp.]|uniref:helix-turn-helix transcriptional regulator n=1 Tax=Undibacterium sp. TaxID=1914977 RepID=UPI00374DDFFB